MANANWSNPTLTSTYTNFVTEVKNRDEDLALQFDGTTSTNIPTNTIRWDSSANRWKKWNGTSWAELTSTYALTALSTTGNASIGGVASVPAGSATAASLAVGTGTTYAPGIYSPGTDQLALATGGSGRLFINSSGQVGVGISSPSERLEISGNFKQSNGTQGVQIVNATVPYIQAFTSGGNNPLEIHGQDLRLFTGASFGAETERLRITSGGLVGIGTSSPGSALTVATTGSVLSGTGNNYGFYINPISSGYIYLDAITGTTANTSLAIRTYNNGTYNTVIQSISAGDTTFSTNGTERARIDSSGRLLVGTSSARSNFYGNVGTYSGLLNIESTGNSSRVCSLVQNGTNAGQEAVFVIGRSRGTTVGAYDLVANGDYVGTLSLQGADGSKLVPLAEISAVVDGTPGANDMPGRLLFSTTADGATSPTERMRITSAGLVGIGTASPGTFLDVNFSSTLAYSSSDIAGYNGLKIWNASATGGFASIALNATDTSGLRNCLTTISCISESSNSRNSSLTFATRNESSGAVAERARIDSSGYLTGTVNGLGKGIYSSAQYYRLNAPLAGSNVNTAQSILGVGVTLVASTVYEFEGVFAFSKSAGTTSHTFGMGFGGTATLNNIGYAIVKMGGTTSATALEGTTSLIYPTAATTTVLTVAITSAANYVQLHVKGTVSVNAGGTFIPQYTLSAAPGGAYTTALGSYFKIAPLGASGANTSIGTWA